VIKRLLLAAQLLFAAALPLSAQPLSSGEPGARAGSQPDSGVSMDAVPATKPDQSPADPTESSTPDVPRYHPLPAIAQEADLMESSPSGAELAVQEDMARSARWAAGAALASVMLSAVGVYLIWRTLLYTRNASRSAADAVKEAENATSAARESMRETMRIGEAQVRAYLTVEALVVPQLEGSDLDHPQNFSIKISNSGQSPARNVQALAYANWVPRQLPVPCPDLVKLADSGGPGFSISSGQSVGCAVQSDLTAEDFFLKDTNSGQQVPSVFGIVWYEDVFGCRHRTRFAFHAELRIVTESVPRIGDQVGMTISLSAAAGHNDET
jgi:hypothetical protein